MTQAPKKKHLPASVCMTTTNHTRSSEKAGGDSRMMLLVCMDASEVGQFALSVGGVAGCTAPHQKKRHAQRHTHS